MKEPSIRHIMRKGNKVAGCVWGIRERKWGGDFRSKMMMFESMIVSNIDVRGRDLGWKEQEEVEKVQEKYSRRVLGVGRETPGYTVRE
jgi:hypothetical protein